MPVVLPMRLRGSQAETRHVGVRVILVIDGKVIMNSDGVGVRATARIVDGAWGDSNGERFPFPFPDSAAGVADVGKRGPSHGGAETKLKAIAIPGEWGSALLICA